MRNSESTQTASKSILMRCGVRCGSYCKSGCEIRKRHAFVFCVCGGGGESGGIPGQALLGSGPLPLQARNAGAIIRDGGGGKTSAFIWF